MKFLMLKKVTANLAAGLLCAKLHEYCGHFYPQNVKLILKYGQTFHEAFG